MPGFWERLFGGKKSSPVGEDSTKTPGTQGSAPAGEKQVKVSQTGSEETGQTAPLSEDQLQGVSLTLKTFQPTQVGLGSAQSVGRVRDHNEDTLFTINAIMANGDEDVPFGLFLIADGMGGHQNGEVASRMAAHAAAGVILNRLYLPLLTDSSEGGGEPLHELLESAVREAQHAVTRRAPGGGTTLTMALMLGDKIIISHVGDSRAYFLFPDGRVQLMTQDHSLVRRLVELGQLTEEEAAVHPQRNVLYRAIGQAEPFRPDVITNEAPRPGYLLVCSDGLWGLIPEAELFRIITSAPNPSAAAHDLVDAANANGGTDNISAIVVQFYS